MKKLHSIFLIFLFPIIIFSQDFYADFNNACATQDTFEQKLVLENWEKEKPNDPELYTSYFNYYFNKSKNSGIRFSKEKPDTDEEYLEMTDEDGKFTGYMLNEIYYLEEDLEKCFEKIDQGIKLHPNRLDMRFGKIYALGQTENWEPFTNEIISTINQSTKNNNVWTWTLDEKLEDGKEVMLGSIQDYQLQLYNTGNENLLLNMRKISNTILGYYPQHVESLSNLAITYLLLEDYKKALKPLLKAEKIAPTDIIVLSNIAQTYKLLKKKKKSIDYYNKIIKHGGIQEKEFAKNQISLLKG